jgi:restriction system protein
MGYLIALAFAFFVLAILLDALISVAKAIGEGAAESKNALVLWLGRKRFGAKAFIPEALDPLPEKDVDAVKLKAYSPKASIGKVLECVVFRGEVEEFFTSPLKEPDHTLDIHEINDLLCVETAPTYKSVFSTLGKKPAYPVAPLPAPPELSPPPSWTPWSREIGEPSFAPPYYGPRLAFLNRFVDAAYCDETNKVKTADSQRRRLLHNIVERNTEVAQLAEQAKAAYESALARQQQAHHTAMARYEKQKHAYESAFTAEQERLGDRHALLSAKGEPGLLARLDATLRSMSVPDFVSREGQSRFDAESGILIHEHRFPDLTKIEWLKLVELKSGLAPRAANQKEKKEAAMRVYPSMCLRLAWELSRIDKEGVVKAIAINGWVDYNEKATGQQKRAYCASLFANKEQLSNLNLEKLDAVEAFSSLKGIFARSIEITPIAPVIRLNTTDKRFVDGKEVLDGMAGGENLAAMDWEDFEHLCRQLFERAFASSGAEVKVTQASRDQGVDAIIFDPDPLRGGKIVIQAKRYTNTVDVSAVRDLFGTVHNEGAIKGILVTTSQYGPDSYSFAKDKPLTLLDGAQLLGLLEQHGYKFRIDLAEAKRLLQPE